MPTTVTRTNIDSFLDGRELYSRGANGKWYQIRRNGATKKWKLDDQRIRIPYRVNFRGFGAIDEGDFLSDGTLDANKYRHVDDVPEDRRV